MRRIRQCGPERGAAGHLVDRSLADAVANLAQHCAHAWAIGRALQHLLVRVEVNCRVEVLQVVGAIDKHGVRVAGFHADEM